MVCCEAEGSREVKSMRVGFGRVKRIVDGIIITSLLQPRDLTVNPLAMPIAVLKPHSIST